MQKFYSKEAKRSKNTWTHKNLYMNVHRNIILNSWKVETTHMSINWRMDNGIYANKKEWHSCMCYDMMSLENITLGESRQMIPYIVWFLK